MIAITQQAGGKKQIVVDLTKDAPKKRHTSKPKKSRTKVAAAPKQARTKEEALAEIKTLYTDQKKCNF